MLSVSQNWKEKLGNYLIPNRELLTPEELIKIEYAIDGQTLTFTKGDIISFSQKNSADLNSLTLPKDEIQFEIDNIDGRWNPDNPQGLYQKITEKQKVDLYYGITYKQESDLTRTNLFPNEYYSATWTKKRFAQLSDKKCYVYNQSMSSDKDIFIWQYTITEAGKYIIGYSNLSANEWRANPSPGSVTYSYTVNSGEPVEYTFSPTAGEAYDHTFDKVALNVGDVVTVKMNVSQYMIFINRWKCAPFMYQLNDDETVTSNPMPLLGEDVSIHKNEQIVEWHKAGTFYMSGWDCPQNGLTASFTATSQLDFGTDKFGEVTYSSVPTCKDVCQTAFNHIGISSSKYSIDESLDDYNVPYKDGTTYTVDLFNSTTDAQVIQYCANAAMCRIRYDVNGKIYIEPMDTGGELSDYIIDLFTSYYQPEYVLSKQIKDVIINSNLVVSLANDGENQQISNALITTQLHANLFAGWLGRVLNTRKTISGEYRCDPRIQPYDYIKTVNKYAVNETFITDVAISYAGSFKATYTGRVMKSVPSQDVYGLLYAGDKQRAGNTIS